MALRSTHYLVWDGSSRTEIKYGSDRTSERIDADDICRVTRGAQSSSEDFAKSRELTARICLNGSALVGRRFLGVHATTVVGTKVADFNVCHNYDEKR